MKYHETLSDKKYLHRAISRYSVQSWPKYFESETLARCLINLHTPPVFLKFVFKI